MIQLFVADVRGGFWNHRFREMRQLSQIRRVEHVGHVNKCAISSMLLVVAISLAALVIFIPSGHTSPYHFHQLCPNRHGLERVKLPDQRLV